MKGNKEGITVETFFQITRDLANVDLKEMAGEREEKRKSLYKIVPLVPLVPMSHCPI